MALSNHNLTFCTRKLIRQKFGIHKQIKCRSSKKYTPEKLVEELKSSNFPNYENYKDINDAYSNFISLFSAAINKVAPLREIRVKNRTHDWFDRDISNAIEARNEKLKTFKRTREILDEESLKRSKAQVQNLIKNKKKVFIENKLKNNVGKPKELWKVLKSLGLPKKSTPISNICLKSEGKHSYGSEENAELFKNYFNELAKNLLLKLPQAPNIFGYFSTTLYYSY